MDIHASFFPINPMPRQEKQNRDRIIGELGKAKSLEFHDDLEAFRIYCKLLEDKQNPQMPQAALRRGLMLLEGRGTDRHFGKALEDIRCAAENGHPKAQALLANLENRECHLRFIAKNLVQLNTPDAAGLTTRPMMPSRLQYAVLDLILSDAPAGEKIITHLDITTAFDDLIHLCAEGTSERKILEAYRQHGTTCFLPQLVSAVLGQVLMTPELQRSEINQILLYKKKNSVESCAITYDDIATTSASYAARLIIPNWLVEKQAVEMYRYRWIASLLSEGVVDWNRENKSAVCIVTQAPDIPEGVWRDAFTNRLTTQEILLFATTSRFHQQTFVHNMNDANFWKSRLCLEGEQRTVIDEKLKSSNAKTIFMEHPDLREAAYLAKFGITDRLLIAGIKNGSLTVAHILDRFRAFDRLSDKYPSPPVFKSNIQLGWIKARFADGWLGKDDVCSLSLDGVTALGDPDVQRWFLSSPEKNFWILKSLRYYSRFFIESLKSRYMRLLIDNPIFSRLRWGRVYPAVDSLCQSEDLQKWLLHNPTYISGFFELSGRAYLLQNAWIREQITKGKLTFTQLGQMGERQIQTLLNPAVQKWLGHPKRQRDLEQILKQLCLPCGSGQPANNTWLLELPWIRNYIKNKLLTIEQLNNASEEFLEFLQDKTIHSAWLSHPGNESYLKNVGNLSADSVSLLLKKDVRKWIVNERIHYESFKHHKNGYQKKS